MRSISSPKVSLKGLLLLGLFLLQSPLAFSACDDALGPNYAASEMFREQIYEALAAMFFKLEGQRSTLANAFIESIAERNDLQPDEKAQQAMQKFGVKPVAGELPPDISGAAIDALERTFDFDTYSRLKTPEERTETYRRLIEEAKEIVRKDPYFVFLKDRKLPNKKNKDVDPVDHLFELFTDSGPRHLPLMPSIARVYRDFDPDMTGEQHTAAQSILNLQALLSILDNDLMPMFENRDVLGGAWNSAPDLATALTIHRGLLNGLVKRHEAKLTRRAFEQVMKSLADEGSDAAIATFKKHLGKTLSDETVRRIFSEMPKNIAYEEFLARAFGGDEHEAMLTKLDSLKRILDVAQAVLSETSLHRLLQEKLATSTHLHF